MMGIVPDARQAVPFTERALEVQLSILLFGQLQHGLCSLANDESSSTMKQG
ncbi:MAG: hypothetical protein ACXABY_14840 [Candidatus Thorarchaeota archaeon]